MIRFSNCLRSAETPDDYRVERIFIVAAQELNAPLGGVMQKPPSSESSMNSESFLNRIFTCGFVITVLMFCVSTSNAEEEMGYIFIRSQPERVVIYLDDNSIGITPLSTPLEVEPGQHKLELDRNDRKRYRDRILIERGKTLEINAKLAPLDSEARSESTEVYVETYITVVSEPPSADVFLDDKIIGRTPVMNYAVIAQSGKRRDKLLRVTKLGYQKYQQKIKKDDIRREARLRLPLIELQAITSMPRSTPSENGRSILSIFAIILAVIAVAAGVWIAAIRFRRYAVARKIAQNREAQTTPLFPVRQRGKWGYVDQAGYTVIAPCFGDAGSFSEGLSYVSIRPKWSFVSKYGYIDETGAIAIKPQFDHAWDFSNGFACVEIGGKYGYIDRTGKMVTELQFDWASDLSGGMGWVRKSNDYEQIRIEPDS